MIMYTIVPQELLFQAEQSVSNSHSAIQVNGVPMLVQQNGDQSCEIVRLLSSNPQHYLDSQYAPGQKISISYRLN